MRNAEDTLELTAGCARIFKPAEASAVAVAYALVVGVVVYRAIRIKDLLPSFSKSVISSSVIMFIIANAGLFA